MTTANERFTREQGLLLIDLAVKMAEDGADSKRRALFYLRRSIPVVLPCWIQSQAPIKTWTADDLITTGRLIVDGVDFPGAIGQSEGLTCQEIEELGTEADPRGCQNEVDAWEKLAAAADAADKEEE